MRKRICTHPQMCRPRRRQSPRWGRKTAQASDVNRLRDSDGKKAFFILREHSYPLLLDMLDMLEVDHGTLAG